MTLTEIPEIFEGCWGHDLFHNYQMSFFWTGHDLNRSFFGTVKSQWG